MCSLPYLVHLLSDVTCPFSPTCNHTPPHPNPKPRVFKHRHQVEAGRTSSAGYHLLGLLRGTGVVTNSGGRVQPGGGSGGGGGTTAAASSTRATTITSSFRADSSSQFTSAHAPSSDGGASSGPLFSDTMTISAAGSGTTSTSSSSGEDAFIHHADVHTGMGNASFPPVGASNSPTISSVVAATRPPASPSLLALSAASSAHTSLNVLHSGSSVAGSGAGGMGSDGVHNCGSSAIDSGLPVSSSGGANRESISGGGNRSSIGGGGTTTGSGVPPSAAAAVAAAVAVAPLTPRELIKASDVIVSLVDCAGEYDECRKRACLSK